MLKVIKRWLFKSELESFERKYEDLKKDKEIQEFVLAADLSNAYKQIAAREKTILELENRQRSFAYYLEKVQATLYEKEAILEKWGGWTRDEKEMVANNNPDTELPDRPLSETEFLTFFPDRTHLIQRKNPLALNIVKASGDPEFQRFVKGISPQQYLAFKKMKENHNVSRETRLRTTDGIVKHEFLENGTVRLSR